MIDRNLQNNDERSANPSHSDAAAYSLEAAQRVLQPHGQPLEQHSAAGRQPQEEGSRCLARVGMPSTTASAPPADPMPARFSLGATRGWLQVAASSEAARSLAAGSS